MKSQLELFLRALSQTTDLLLRALVTMQQSPDDLDSYLEVALSAAKRAGEIIASNFYQKKNVEHKGTVDLVTETDKACEALILESISSSFPSHQFIGEEGSAGNGGVIELTDAPTWMVDPLDGTTNFVHCFPMVCVSIGLAIKKEVVVGVVFNPILQELFWSVRGRGAFLNGASINVSSQKELGSALLATEIGTSRDVATVDTTTGRINKLLSKVRSVRMSGSCAMNLVGVACGRLDAFFEYGFGGPWDVAAGSLILEEAGGKVFDPRGAPFDIMSRRVAATNADLKHDLVDALDDPERSNLD